MKKLLIALIVIMAAVQLSAKTVQPSVNGKKFVGKPSKQKPSSGCEGCGQPGYFSFSEQGNKVELIWPDSDEIDSGTYVQKKLLITVTSVNSGKIVLTLSKDGKVLTDKKTKIAFRHDKFPW